jgi:hypothetical protein
VLNATDGKIISTIPRIGGGDEDWYKPGGGRFYFTSNDKSAPPVDSLGVIDAQTGARLQNVPDPGSRQWVALGQQSHLHTRSSDRRYYLKTLQVTTRLARSSASRARDVSRYSRTPRWRKVEVNRVASRRRGYRLPDHYRVPPCCIESTCAVICKDLKFF